MPEHLRALIVVLGLASFIWLLIQPSIAHATSPSVARAWRNLWFAMTAAAFTLGNFWLYVLLAGAVLMAQRFTTLDALAAYLLLLLTVPAASVDVPGFGLINYFFTLNQPRLLALMLLLPAAVRLSREGGTVRLGSNLTDKLFLGYLLLTAVLQLRESNLTSTLRGCFYLLIDMFLPYYVASRALRRTDDFRMVFSAFGMALALLGVLAIFEVARHWNLYAAMTKTLGLHWGLGGYLGRGGLLRASGSTGQAIALGYVMVVGLALQFFVLHGTRHASPRLKVPALLMAGGMLASLSRGPWVGMAAALLAYLWTGRNGVRNTVRLGICAIAAIGLMSLFGFGQKIINLLPFIGNVEVENITYRQRLVDNALIVIERHLWLGSTDYLQTPEMQSMIQGQGIIDIVNTFLGVTLDYGIVGLSLFAGFFVSVLWRLWRAQARIPQEDERRVLGRSLLAALVGIVVTITTVSSITVISMVYWSVAGMGVAWLEMMRRADRLRA